jgi:hypothetical protein
LATSDWPRMDATKARQSRESDPLVHAASVVDLPQ